MYKYHKLEALNIHSWKSIKCHCARAYKYFAIVLFIGYSIKIKYVYHFRWNLMFYLFWMEAGMETWYYHWKILKRIIKVHDQNAPHINGVDKYNERINNINYTLVCFELVFIFMFFNSSTASSRHFSKATDSLCSVKTLKYNTIIRNIIHESMLYVFTIRNIP